MVACQWARKPDVFSCIFVYLREFSWLNAPLSIWRHSALPIFGYRSFGASTFDRHSAALFAGIVDLEHADRERIVAGLGQRPFEFGLFFRTWIEVLAFEGEGLSVRAGIGLSGFGVGVEVIDPNRRVFFLLGI